MVVGILQHQLHLRGGMDGSYLRAHLVSIWISVDAMGVDVSHANQSGDHLLRVQVQVDRLLGKPLHSLSIALQQGFAYFTHVPTPWAM